MERRDAHIIVLGAGFAGITFCQEYFPPPTRLTLVDRYNHHLFQPLLYQVATAGLAPAEIAQPIRSILSGKENVTVLMDRVMDFDLNGRTVQFEHSRLAYDNLVIALGGTTSYFAHPEWERIAPGLKTLEDAIRIRRNILLAFERAENSSDLTEQQRLMTIVVVGGGPTGVELAGAFAELTRYVLRSDFRRIDPTRAQVILIEASTCVLSNLPPELSEAAHNKLLKLGVRLKSSAKVQELSPGRVQLNTGEIIHAENIIWAAGVSANPLTRRLGVPLDRAGRIIVEPDLSLPGHPEVFAIGDIALVKCKDGSPVPGVSPAAMQMARHVARYLQDTLASPGQAHRLPFEYFDRGTMATIGRSAAVAHIRRLKFNGFLAWLAWLFVHLIFLIGFRNKLAVLLQWAYSYFTYKRGARLITNVVPEPTPEQPAMAASIGQPTRP